MHEMLERIADKWTLLVIDALDDRRELRFSRLREQLGGVSQKDILKKGIEARMNAVVDFAHTDDKSTKPPLPILFSH